MENQDNLPDKIARKELLKVFGPAILAALMLFFAKGSFKCPNEPLKPLDTEDPVIEKIAPIQNQTKNELSEVFVPPGECPEGILRQITCNSEKTIKNIIPVIPLNNRLLDGQYFGDGPGINAHL